MEEASTCARRYQEREEAGHEQHLEEQGDEGLKGSRFPQDVLSLRVAISKSSR